MLSSLLITVSNLLASLLSLFGALCMSVMATRQASPLYRAAWSGDVDMFTGGFAVRLFMLTLTVAFTLIFARNALAHNRAAAQSPRWKPAGLPPLQASTVS